MCIKPGTENSIKKKQSCLKMAQLTSVTNDSIMVMTVDATGNVPYFNLVAGIVLNFI